MSVSTAVATPPLLPNEATRFERALDVLVVGDEPTLRRNVARLLLARGMRVVTASDGAQAIDVLNSQSFDVALVDLMMPNVGGLELLEDVKSSGLNVEMVVMTAFGDVETAVRTVRSGAFHFLTKPFRSNDEVVVSVQKAAEHRRLVSRTQLLERRLKQAEGSGELVGSSSCMRESLQGGESADAESAFPESAFDLPFREAKQRALEAFESAYLSKQLARACGNVSEAARIAGLDRSNFRRVAKRAGVIPAKG